jgi:alpha-beta hydrolase superfamily lysophospholipase
VQYPFYIVAKSARVCDHYYYYYYIKRDYYVITVDWSKGAEELNYFQAVADTRLVGAEIARLLNAVKEVAHIMPGSVHIIGHSLGAHIAGYVGKIIPGISRITGNINHIHI